MSIAKMLHFPIPDLFFRKYPHPPDQVAYLFAW